MGVEQQLQSSWNVIFKRLSEGQLSSSDSRIDINKLSTEEQIEYYRNWLKQRYTHDTKEQNLRESAQYAEKALQPVEVNGTTLTPFAPFRKDVSAYRVVTLPQKIILGIIIALFVLSFVVNFTIAITVIVAAITLFYFFSLFLNFALTLKSVTDPGHIEIENEIVDALADAPWPRYTILCPLYQEEESAPQLIRALREIDYPSDRLQVLIMLEEDDKGTLAVLNSLELPSFVEIIMLPDGKPRTKPRSCNYGFAHATGDYAVIYDAEDIPDPQQLKKAVLTFAQFDDNLACVQAKLNYYNVNQNALTRWFTIEYSTWYEMVMPGLQWAKLSIPLGGTSNHFSAKILRKLGAWDAFNVTEDCDLGMRLEHDDYYTVVLDSTTYEEANSQLPNWLTQRTRWIKGFLITYMVYMRNPLRYMHPKRWAEFFSLQFVIGGRTLVVLLNPILWILMAGYLVLGDSAQDLYDQIFPGPIFYMGFFSLIIGNMVYIYTHMFGAIRIKRYDLVRWAALMPIYWIFHSIAGYKALYNSILRPHFWEKTKHGLNTNSVDNEVPDVAIYTQDDKGNTRRLYDEIELAKIKRYKPVADKSKGGVTGNIFSRLFQDKFFAGTLGIAMISAMVSLWYFVGNGLSILSTEAGVNLYVARRIFDSATAGLGQLSYEQLPLYHLLVGPFTLSPELFASGLAGSIVSAIAYVLAVAYIYLIARTVTDNRPASFVGTLVFALNPNILFLQSMPLVTMLSIATLLGASYHFIRWIKTDNPRTVVTIAIAVFLATLTSYPGWLLFGFLLFAIPYIGKKREYTTFQLEGNLILYGLFGGLAILIWIAWNAVILGNPVPGFGVAPVPSEARILASYDGLTLMETLRTLFFGIIDVVGVVPFALAVTGGMYFTLKQRESLVSIGVMSLFVPIVAIGSALMTGHLAVSIPQMAESLALPELLNTDVIALAVPTIAILVSVSIHGIQQVITSSDQRPVLKPIVATAVAGLVIVSAGMFIANDNLLTMKEAQSRTINADHSAIVQHLSENYQNGIVWISRPDEIAYPLATVANVSYINMIHRGNVDNWVELEADPTLAEWIIINTVDEDDSLLELVDTHGADYLSGFELVMETDTGEQLFKRS